MQFGFFDDVEPQREPTQEEWDSVVRQTELFYEETMQARFPDGEFFKFIIDGKILSWFGHLDSVMHAL